MNLRRLLVALVPVVAGGLVAAGCDSVRPFALKVNGSEVSQSSVGDELEAIADRLTGRDDVLASSATARWMTLRVEQEVIDEQFTRDDLRVTPEDRQQAELDAENAVNAEFQAAVFAGLPDWLQDRVRDRYARRIALARAVGGTTETGVSDADVQAAYDEELAAQRAQCPSGRFVAHILVASQDAAADAAERVAAGEEFATVARDVSTDAQSARVGGELGCADQQFIDPFSQAAAALAPGQVSEPVQTEFGFHLIKISDTIPFAALEPAIREQLEQQAGVARDPEIDALVADADVEIDPRYGRWRVRDGVGRVEAPAGAQPPSPPPGPQP